MARVTHEKLVLILHDSFPHLSNLKRDVPTSRFGNRHGYAFRPPLHRRSSLRSFRVPLKSNQLLFNLLLNERFELTMNLPCVRNSAGTNSRLLCSATRPYLAI